VPQRNALPSQTGRAPVSARGTRTREALVKAARHVFERDGFLDARITDITAQAGVAAGSFYTYFTRKEDAFAAVMEDVNEEMLHPGLGPDIDREDPVAVIEAANRAYLVSYRRNARLMALMDQVAQIDGEFRELRLRRASAFVDRNARAIARLQRRGLADPELDPKLAALAMSAMVSRTAYVRYVEGIGSASAETLTKTLTRLWAGALGITARAAGHPTTTRS
jgi:AcrR family transcriptional regulator